MLRSGYVLILAVLIPTLARASTFDYERFVGAVAGARVCESNLTFDHPPFVDQPVGAYVADLSRLRFEAELHRSVSLSAVGGQLATLLNPPAMSSDPDLIAMRRMGLNLMVIKNNLGITFGSTVIYLHPFTEPIHAVRAVRENSRGGYLTLIGWTSTMTLRLVDGQLTPVDESPFDPPSRRLVTPPRDGEDVELEPVRLAARADHQRSSASPSVLREALGALAERVLERATAICHGRGARGGLVGGGYPNSLLALAALAIAGDYGLRNLIAVGLNEHPAAEFTVRAAVETPARARGGGSVAFELRATGCPALRFSVPDDPFTNADGWGYVL